MSVMTATEVLDNACGLLGYLNNMNSTPDEIRKAALPLVNQIYADISYCIGNRDAFVPLESLGDALTLPKGIILDVVVPGLAAAIAMSKGDSDRQQYFSIIYNQKRLSINNFSTIKDVLPKV